MENNQKPEWFELADNDQPKSRPLKKRPAPLRGLTYLLAGALVIPMGAGFALLTHEDHSAISSQALNLIQDSPAATTPTQVLPASASSTAKAPVAITPPGSAANEIILPPTKKAGDDNDDDDNDDEEDDDDDEEEDDD